MKIVDSTGWVEYFARGPLFDEYREHVADLTDLLTPTIVLYEVFKRVLQRLDRNSALKAAALLGETKLVELDRSVAIAAAEASIEHKLPMADAIIYATARLNEATIITSNKHFEGLPGVLFIPLPQQEERAEQTSS